MINRTTSSIHFDKDLSNITSIRYTHDPFSILFASHLSLNMNYILEPPSLTRFVLSYVDISRLMPLYAPDMQGSRELNVGLCFAILGLRRTVIRVCCPCSKLSILKKKKYNSLLLMVINVNRKYVKMIHHT